MVTERLSMRKTREILRQKWVLKRSHREVHGSLQVCLGTVSKVVSRAALAGLDWDAVCALDDDTLHVRLNGPRVVPGTARPPPDVLYVHTELKRVGVTRELLYREYREQHPDGYAYTRFCTIYHAWLVRQRRVMRQEHRAGEKFFVDYSGKLPAFIDPLTGECRPVELFVGVLGASNYTFAEATLTQQSHDWIASHTRALEFLGGVPELLVPDQLKSGVTRACRYEPEVQRSYADFAEHYGTAVLPARPLHPRDKAKVEVGVLIAQRWILARLRNLRCFSLHELNEHIAVLLTALNERTMRVYKTSRRALFELLDRPALKPLPSARYEFAQWKTARAQLDYHVEVEGHFYSVPHTLVNETLTIRATATTVEVLLRGNRVAVHARGAVLGRHTTVIEHMPKAHRKHLEWTPVRILHWAGTIGAETSALMTAMLSAHPHPEHGYRSCLGILRLAKRFSEARLEVACGRANKAGARSYRHVESILKNGLDRVATADETPAERDPVPHANVRGADYYNGEDNDVD